MRACLEYVHGTSFSNHFMCCFYINKVVLFWVKAYFWCNENIVLVNILVFSKCFRLCMIFLLRCQVNLWTSVVNV